jgi:hypothetical protein
LVANIGGKELFSLSEDGAVFQIEPVGDKISAKLICRVPKIGQMLDLSPFTDGVVALQFNPSTGVTQCSLCSRQGVVTPFRQFTGAYGGIAWDSEHSILWVVNSLTREIHRIDGTRDLFVRDIPGARTIVAMSFDARRQILYAADPVNGDLFAVQIPTNAVKKVGTNLGDIRAIAVDTLRHELMVVDAARRRVWIVPELNGLGKPKEFLNFSKGTEPCAIAIAYDRAWVADCKKKRIYSSALVGGL